MNIKENIESWLVLFYFHNRCPWCSATVRFDLCCPAESCALSVPHCEEVITSDRLRLCNFVLCLHTRVYHKKKHCFRSIRASSKCRKPQAESKNLHLFSSSFIYLQLKNTSQLGQSFVEFLTCFFLEMDFEIVVCSILTEYVSMIAYGLVKIHHSVNYAIYCTTSCSNCFQSVF